MGTCGKEKKRLMLVGRGEEVMFTELTKHSVSMYCRLCSEALP